MVKPWHSIGIAFLEVGEEAGHYCALNDDNDEHIGDSHDEKDFQPAIKS